MSARPTWLLLLVLARWAAKIEAGAMMLVLLLLVPLLLPPSNGSVAGTSPSMTRAGREAGSAAGGPGRGEWDMGLDREELCCRTTTLLLFPVEGCGGSDGRLDGTYCILERFLGEMAFFLKGEKKQLS